MKDRILYSSYEGTEPYIFLRFNKADKPEASLFVNTLIDKMFRVSYNQSGEEMTDAEWLADRINSSKLVIFLISAESLKSLEFRSSINYAISQNKNVFCIFMDDNKLGFGFEMQLSSIPGVRRSSYKDMGELAQDILTTDHFLQTMRGDDAKQRIKSNRKKVVALSLLASVLVLFIVAGAVIIIHRINYENSLAGQIEKLTETAYLDISNEDASIIELLDSKTIKTLVARDMGLTDISALQYVSCEELDISQNPKVNTLEPLLEIESLKIVKVTQDMYPALRRIGGRHAFKVVITG